MTIKQIRKNRDDEELLNLTGESAAAEESFSVADSTPAVSSVEKATGFDDSVYQAAKPAYTNNYAGEIDSLMDQLENRREFSYDPDNDPLYQQYKTQYRREGSRAVDDTLAAAASHAGGMNSYAVSAAQQAANYHNAQLADRIPELAQLAYEMYQADYGRDLDRLSLLRDREAEDYDRYQDALAEWYDQLESAYQQYRDSVADSKWREQMDYEKEQDALDRQQWQQDFDYEKEQDAIANAQRYPQYAQPGQTDVPAAPEASGDRWSGTDYYRDAIEAALRGDRNAAEAALAKRGEKMASPDYHGTGGGTSMEEAYAYVESLLAGTEQAEEDTSRSTDGRTYDNGSLTRDQVQELQNYYEVDADGLWGKNSTAAAGGQTAEQAWEEYQRLNNPGAPSTGVDYDPESGAYRWDGRAYEDLAALEQGINSAGLTTAELEELARELKELGVSTEWVR